MRPKKSRKFKAPKTREQVTAWLTHIQLIDSPKDAARLIIRFNTFRQTCRVRGVLRALYQRQFRLLSGQHPTLNVHWLGNGAVLAFLAHPLSLEKSRR